MKRILQLSFVLSLMLLLSSCHLVTSDDGPYLITFDSNGGTSIDSMTVESFDPFLPEEVPTKEGYTFGGWYLDEAFYYPMSFNAGTNEALTLYAKWIDDQIIPIEVDEEAIIDEIFERLDIIETFESRITTMLDDVKQSVVMIETDDGGGSGIIYKKVGNTYYVLTNEHVVYDYDSNDFYITVFDGGGEVLIPKGSITLKGSSLEHDMAVLTFTSTRSFRVIEMAQKSDIRVGEFVFAIGSPLDLPNSVSMGLISAIDRPMWDDYGMDTITIQHTAAINPGNSGGALVDIYGRLVGLNNMSYVDTEVGEGIEGLHFAIQIDILVTHLSELE